MTLTTRLRGRDGKRAPRRYAACRLDGCVVVRPGMGSRETGAALLLGAAVCNALYQLTIRKLRTADGSRTTSLYTALDGAALPSFAVPAFPNRAAVNG